MESPTSNVFEPPSSQHPKSAQLKRRWQSRWGLRSWLVAALSVLTMMAFVPLYLAVARLTRHALESQSFDSAHVLARSVAGRLAAEQRTVSGPSVMADVIDASLETAIADGSSKVRVGVIAARVVSVGGTSEPIERGDSEAISELRRAPQTNDNERMLRKSSTRLGQFLVFQMHSRNTEISILVQVGDSSVNAQPLLRLVAFYMTAFALALLLFTFFAITRLVVQPVGVLLQSTHLMQEKRLRLVDLSPALHGAREIAELALAVIEATGKLHEREQALASQVTQLEAARLELIAARDAMIRSERLASVGRLSAGLAHEVGNPIAAMIGLAEVLLTFDLDSDALDLIRRLRKEAERIHVIMRNLLDFARAGAQTPSASGTLSCDVQSVIRESIDLMSHQQDFRAVKIETSFMTDCPLAHIDPAKLEQVLINLLLNAMDVLKDSLSVEKRILVEMHKEGESLCVAVHDSGPGVNDSIKESIFEPFFSTKDVGKGTGLGLAVSRSLIEASNGQLVVSRSERLGGACFQILLMVSSRH